MKHCYFSHQKQLSYQEWIYSLVLKFTTSLATLWSVQQSFGKKRCCAATRALEWEEKQRQLRSLCLVSLVHCFCEEVTHAPKDLDGIQSPKMAMNCWNTVLCTCCFAGLADWLMPDGVKLDQIWPQSSFFGFCFLSLLLISGPIGETNCFLRSVEWALSASEKDFL